MMSFVMALALTAQAALFEVEDGGLVGVPLNTTTGTVVHLPGIVRVVTPSKTLEIAPLGAGGAPASSGKKPVPYSAVEFLSVKVREGYTPETEMVTFAMVDGRSITVMFSPGGAVDNFADLRFPAPVRSESARPSGFLPEERELMALMLRDDLERREVVDETVVYDQYPELSWQLRRRFRFDGLTGYVFVLENLTNKPLRLDPSVLSVDRPTRLALVQVDHDGLLPCDKTAQDPRGGGCRTILRMVVHETGAVGMGASTGAGPVVGSKLPFVYRDTKDKRR